MNGITINRVYLEPEPGRQILVRLGQPIGSAGSHGEVRLIEDAALGGLVVKLIHNPAAQRLGERLTALLKDTRRWDAQGSFRAAWPAARALHADDKHDVGFAMPRLGAPRYYPMQIMFDPSAHIAVFPGASWSRYLMVAADLARGIGLVHERGYVIGDLCPDNLFITPSASVALADVDDWQIGRRGLPGSLPCRGSRPDYTAPELLESPVGDSFRQPSSDRWALAVVIGELLFTGTRPFAGFPADAHPAWEDRDSVQARRCWLLGADVSVAAATPSRDLLPGPLRELFERCFVAGYESPDRRPAPEHWADTIEAVIGELDACDQSPLHVYPRTCRQCPWCEIVARGRLDKFGTVAAGPIRSDPPLRPASRPNPAAVPNTAGPSSGDRAASAATGTGPGSPGRSSPPARRAGPTGAAVAVVTVMFIIIIIILAAH